MNDGNKMVKLSEDIWLDYDWNKIVLKKGVKGKEEWMKMDKEKEKNVENDEWVKNGGE